MMLRLKNFLLRHVAQFICFTFLESGQWCLVLVLDSLSFFFLEQTEKGERKRKSLNDTLLGRLFTGFINNPIKNDILNQISVAQTYLNYSNILFSGNAFVSKAGGPRFKSRAGQIEHSVANGSPPLRHFLERSCTARAQ